MTPIEILSGLVLGFAFGFVLENAGFGSPYKLTSQFRLADWSVFKVMFTAIVLSLIHISEPTRPLYISYAVFCLKKKK